MYHDHVLGILEAPILTANLEHVSANSIQRSGTSDVYPAYLAKGNGPQAIKVAVKIPRSPQNGQRNLLWEEEKLRKEVEILGGLNHQNIVQILGIASVFGRPAIILPWYPDNASAYIMGLGPSSQEKVNQLIVGLVNAVNYLHDINPPIVHGAITGTSILVDISGEAVLCGFGNARILDGSTADTVENLANLRWLAPELIPGARPTRASDVWALGCTIGELSTRKVPHAARKYLAPIMLAITEAELPFREDDFASCGDNIWEIVTECCIMNQAHRPTVNVVKQRLFQSLLFDIT